MRKQKLTCIGPHTQYFGLLRVIQAVSPHMIEKRSGTIINIGSIAAYGNFPFSAAYNSSKAAVHSLNDALRSELKPFNVRVLLVAPGAIKSSFGDSATTNIEYPSASSPYASAKAILQHRSSVSQQDKPTDAGVFARWVRKEAEKSAVWQRHYLTVGRKSTLGWILFYFPPFLRDFVIYYFFKLRTLSRKA
jgi:1-acylglycerone phosphate reductase